MNNEEIEQSKTEQAYRDMRRQELAEMPDLWNRIEAGFEEEKRQSSARKKIYRRRYLTLAAAALLIAVIAVPVITLTTRIGRNKSDTDNAAVDNAVMESAEELSSDSLRSDMEQEEEEQTEGTSAAWEDAAVMEQAEEQTEESVMTDAADAEVTEDASSTGDQTVNAADSAQTDASDIQNAAASEGMIENPTAKTYRQITEVTLVLTDAAGEISQKVTTDDSADGFEQVQELLRDYAILSWPTETEDGEDSCYKLTVVMEDGTEYSGRFRTDSEYNDRKFSEFANALAK